MVSERNGKDGGPVPNLSPAARRPTCDPRSPNDALRPPLPQPAEAASVRSRQPPGAGQRPREGPPGTVRVLSEAPARPGHPLPHPPDPPQRGPARGTRPPPAAVPCLGEPGPGGRELLLPAAPGAVR